MKKEETPKNYIFTSSRSGWGHLSITTRLAGLKYCVAGLYFTFCHPPTALNLQDETSRQTWFKILFI